MGKIAILVKTVFHFIVAPMTPADSPSCSSHSISYDVQSCVPQYLADLWQGKNFLTLGQNHHTKQVLRSKVCQ